jgi:DNA-binding HxlR family transcriptional regulator
VVGRSDDFCAFEKAAEHLGDRWSLLILRELAMHGTRGFNALVQGLPGVSRSVLSRRLRRLEDLGLICREAGRRGRSAPYRLAPAGSQFLPTLRSLARWADRWVPEDPAAARHDPDVVGFWLSLRVDRDRVPDPPVVIAFDVAGPRAQRAWLVLERGADPSMCLEDPGFGPERTVHVETDAAGAYRVARGLRSWEAAVADRSVRLYGDPHLVRALPDWFLPAEGDARSRRQAG